MRKSLEYYLNLRYKVIIEELLEDDGGGFEAYIKEFGRYTCNGYGETPEEAYQDVVGYKEDLIERWYKEGKTIPEPEKEEISFTGKFTLRVPVELHAELSKSAKENDISFNQYCTYLLSKNLTYFQMLSEIKKAHAPVVPINDMKINIESNDNKSVNEDYQEDILTSA